jgi:hypothetical protein
LDTIENVTTVEAELDAKIKAVITDMKLN